MIGYAKDYLEEVKKSVTEDNTVAESDWDTFLFLIPLSEPVIQNKI